MGRTRLTGQQIGDGSLTNIDIASGPTAGYVLTSGATGSATWEPVSGNGSTGPTGDTGATGDVSYDADRLYVCIAENTWKSISLVDWP